MSDMEKDNERREYRRKRRARNRALAFIALIVIAVLLGVGIYFLLTEGTQYLKKKQAEAEAARQAVAAQAAEGPGESENAEEEKSEEPVAIETPDFEDEPTPTPEEEEVPEESGPERDPKAQELLDKMKLEQKVDALFLVAPETVTGVDRATQAGEGTKDALSNYAVGGIIYNASNVTGADQFKEMIKNTREYYSELYGRELIVAVTEEGAFNTIAGKATGVKAAKTASELAKEVDTEAAYQNYSDMAAYLKEYGVTLNLAPQGSVLTNDKCYLKDRLFGNDPNVAETLVKSAVKGLKDGGIDAAMTAFPGEGELTAAPEKAEAATGRSYTEMRECEFLPYQAAIEEGVSAIVVSNIIWNNTDEGNSTAGDTSACISGQLVNEILRDALGFSGVVITAPMDEKAFSGAEDIASAGVKALNAGADMICVYDKEKFEKIRQGILDALNAGELSEERLDDSLERIFVNLVID